MAVPDPLKPPKLNPDLGKWATIGSNLKTLFQSPVMKTYACYFYLNTIRWHEVYWDTHKRDGFSDAAGEAKDIRHKKPDGTYAEIHFRREDDPPITEDRSKFVSLTVKYMENLAKQAAFDPVTGNSNAAVFVGLDNLNRFLPFDTAGLLAACFLKGLVSRLVLGRYAEDWEKAAGTALPLRFDDLIISHPAPPPPPHPKDALDNFIRKDIEEICQEFSKPSTWVNPSYQDCLYDHTNVSLQVIGILLGWRAGDSLAFLADDDAAKKKAKQDAKTAIWGLVGSRCTTKHVGMMMGYVLMTLVGFLENDRIKEVIKKNDHFDPALLGVGNLSAVEKKFRVEIRNNRTCAWQQKTKGDIPIHTLIESFCRILVGEFYAIPGNNMSAGDRNKALINSSAFMGGFIRGMIMSADELFDDFYNEGYQYGYKQGYQAGWQVGYTTGFRDGYSQGFSAGYTVGYASGHADAFSAMGGLSEIVGGVSNFLDNNSTAILSAGTVGSTILDVATGLGSLF